MVDSERMKQFVIRKFVTFITTKPAFTVLIIAFFTAPMLMHAVNFQDKMTADVMAYLPDPKEEDDRDHPTNLLKEVREEWTTDIILIYVETPNAKNPADKTNITQREVLEEMSRIEGDDIFGRKHGAVDWDKSDRGRNDGVVFVLSVASVIKELNSSSPRFVNAVEKQFTQVVGGDDFVDDDEILADQGLYAIPDDQRRIDNLVNQFSSSLKRMVKDTNEPKDGIWDTATILLAIHHAFDQEEMIDRVNEAVSLRSNYPNPATGKPYTKMTLTGLVVVLHDITDKIYNDLLLMLPFSLAFVAAIMWTFHRTPKIILIVGIPTVITIIWTFGILVLADIELTPMVVAAGPILIGLSVDDALHITNRVGEFHRKGLRFRDCVISTFGTTGRAVLLTTVTTVVGFSALWISDIGPMRTVGTALFVGISLAYIFTVTLVPPLILLTRYEKRIIPLWKNIGKTPVKHRWPILAIALLLTAISVYNISVMNTDIRGDESAPEGIESLDKIKEYTVRFKAGQTNINIVRGDTTDHGNPEPVKTLPLLDVVNHTENDINEIEHCNAISIVDFFKSVKVNVTIPIPEELQSFLPLPTTYEGSLWDFMHLEIWQGNANWQERAIEISYDTLSDEVRAMLINDAYTKTLIYTEMPYINLADTEDIVDEMNRITNEHEEDLTGDGSISETTGGAPISIAINDGIHETQWDTIYLSMIIVTIILFTALYDWRRTLGFNLMKGALTMTPIVMVVLWQPVTMIMGGSANVNIFTAMLGTIIIGIGIDFSIHMSERIAEEGEDHAGIMRAAEGTGQSLVEASSTTIMGVAAGILVSFTSFAGLRNFFFIITALVFYSLLGGLFVLPALYSVLIEKGIIKKLPEGQAEEPEA